MADDGKIYILITNKLPGGTQPTPTPTPDGGSGTESDNESALSKFAMHQFFNFVESQAKQAVSYSISNIGNFTGDFNEQRQVTALMTLAGKAISLGTSIVAGAKIGGVPGAIVAGVFATSSMIIQDVRAERLKSFADAKKNHQIEQLRQRSGMYSLMDGSRGTEN